MLSRRKFSLSLAGALLASPAFAQQSASDDPAAPIVAIYKRMAAGDGTTGGYVIYRKPSRQRWLSRSFAAMWDKSDAVTAKGDQNPPGADPITASQDPKVVDPQVTVETRDVKTAIVAASFRGWLSTPERIIVQYDMVRENGAWKIDDIRTKWDAKDARWWSTRKELGFNIEGVRTGKWDRSNPYFQGPDK